MNLLTVSQPLRLREKLIIEGAQQLSDADLLSVFISAGSRKSSCQQLALELLRCIGNLREILNASATQFSQISGLGLVKFCQLQAVREICRRSDFISLKKETSIVNTQQTHQYIKRKLRDKKNETFAALFLDSQYRVIQFEEMFHGTINAASIHPRPLVERVLNLNAAALIIAHNHPSGLAEASEQDYQVTAVIQQAMELIDVTLLDHLVIGDNEVYSICGQYKQVCN